MNMNDHPDPICIRTLFYVKIRRDGVTAPFFDDFQTLSEAQKNAEAKAKTLNLPITFVDWRHDFANTTGDGVFLEEIRRNEGAQLRPRIWT